MRIHVRITTPVLMALAAVFFARIANGQAGQPTASPASAASSQTQPQEQTTSSTAQARSGEAAKDELKVEQSESQKEVTDINKASNIIGMKVVNKQNEDIGRIKDIVVDFETGRIAYVVLSAGAKLGVGGRLVAIPAESLVPQVGAKALLLDVSKDQLAQAPGFNEDDWPRIDAARDSSVGLSPTGRPSPPSNLREIESKTAPSETAPAEPPPRSR